MKQEKIIISLFLFFLLFSLFLQARDSPFTQKGTGPMYWIAYEYCIDNNVAIPEDRWKKNIDWMAANFKNYGYDMICSDGWIEVAQTINPDGYITKYNSAWTNDFTYWNNYIKNKGMKAGVYYNPLWMTRTAHSQNCPVVNSNVHTQDISGNHWFNSELAWVDVDKGGAEQWIKGYVRHFINLGFTYLRIDFLENYENNYGTEKYEKALRWMKEEAGDEIFLSLVMPNCYNHAEVELKHGDMIRISDDCYGGGWDFVSNRKRGIINTKWPQYWNAFDGFIGFSDIAAKGQMIMDGDFMRMHTMTGINEKQFMFSLMCITGSALAIADQYDTIEDCAWIYQNEELIELNRSGFVAQPISNNIHDKKNSSRWIGQLPDGDWIIGLFNREDSPIRYSINFEKELGIEGGKVYNVRDLWEHKDLGNIAEKYATILEPHSCKVIRITPDFEKNVCMLGAAVNTWDSNNPIMMNSTDDSSIFIYELDLNESAENKLVKFSLNIDDWEKVFYLVPEHVETGKSFAYLQEGMNKMKKSSQITGDLNDHFWGIREGESGRYRLVVNYKDLTLEVTKIDENQHYSNVYMLGEAIGSWDCYNPRSMHPTANKDIFSYELNLNNSQENKLFKFTVNTGDWDEIYYLVPENVESGKSYAYLKEGVNKMKMCSELTGDLVDHFWGIKAEKNGQYKLTVNPVTQILNVEVIDKKEYYENIHMIGEAVNAWDSNNPIYMHPTENNDVFIYDLDLNYSQENKLFKFTVNIGNWDEVYYLIPEQVEPGQNYAFLNDGMNKMKMCSQLTGDLQDHFWGIKEENGGRYRLTLNPVDLTLYVERIYYPNIYMLGSAVNAWDSNNPVAMYTTDNKDIFTYDVDLNYSTENKLLKFIINKGYWNEVYYLIPEEVEDGQSYAYLKEGTNKMKICSELTDNLVDHFWGIKEGENGKYSLTINPSNLTLDVTKIITTNVVNNETVSFKCFTTYNSIHVLFDKTAVVEVYDIITGNLIGKCKAVNNAVFNNLSPRFYLVKVDNQTMKVMVK